jgi:Ca2+-binding RTX toxin-like protein
MIGGRGDDSYIVADAGDTVVESANEGTDTVYSAINYRLAANLENLVLQGTTGLQGYGNNLGNSIYGNTGNNLLDGDTGADAMYGGLGDDSYFVDNGGDAVVENANEGTDAVYSSINYALLPNFENLLLLGAADLQGYGNAVANIIVGNPGSNLWTAAPASIRCMAEPETTPISSTRPSTSASRTLLPAPTTSSRA